MYISRDGFTPFLYRWDTNKMCLSGRDLEIHSQTSTHYKAQRPENIIIHSGLLVKHNPSLDITKIRLKEWFFNGKI